MRTTSDIQKSIDKKEGIIGRCFVCYRPVYRTQKYQIFSGDVMHQGCYETLSTNDSWEAGVTIIRNIRGRLIRIPIKSSPVKGRFENGFKSIL